MSISVFSTDISSSFQGAVLQDGKYYAASARIEYILYFLYVPWWVNSLLTFVS